MFKLQYMDKGIACLAQSPQLYKQMGVCCDLQKVFEVTTHPNHDPCQLTIFFSRRACVAHNQRLRAPFLAGLHCHTAGAVCRRWRRCSARRSR